MNEDSNPEFCCKRFGKMVEHFMKNRVRGRVTSKSKKRVA